MIELKSDSVYMYETNSLEPVCEFHGVNGFVETEIDTYSMSQEVLKLNHEATFNAELISCSPLMTYTEGLGSRPFSIEFDTSIMVQARWHKKPRTNKKWLKRYGMKKDKVRVKCDVNSISTDDSCDSYDLVNSKGFNIELSNVQYQFRPDQLRRNLKIERCCQ